MLITLTAGMFAGSARKPLTHQPAYPFVLPDSSGRLVKSSDFKDRLIILDFWFTGCAPCLALAKAMEPIIEHFNGNDSVVFVNINLDKDKNRWLRSLVEGGTLYRQHIDYVHPNSISLSTYPKGFQHPIAEYYGIIGAPALIIVGKEGEILNRNPPRPSFTSKETIDGFIALLEDYLDTF